MGVSFFNNLPGIILSLLIALLGIFFSDYLGTEIMSFDKSPISSIMLAVIIGLLVGNIFIISEIHQLQLDKIQQVYSFH